MIISFKNSSVFFISPNSPSSSNIYLFFSLHCPNCVSFSIPSSPSSTSVLKILSSSTYDTILPFDSPLNEL
jgi:hypothetical protein